MGGRRAADDPADETTLSMEVREIQRQPATSEGFEPVMLVTSRGDVETRYYGAAGSTRGAIFAGGAGGGFDTPVRGWLYPRMCEDLRAGGIAGLRVSYRSANNLAECVLDVLAGIAFLESEGIGTLALTGHSFGGAVVIQAATMAEAVRTCIPLSTQTYGADAAPALSPRCSLLLGHGTADEVLPHRCSEYVYSIAGQPKKLLLKDGARHGLDEWADELPRILRRWIGVELSRRPDEPPASERDWSAEANDGWADPGPAAQSGIGSGRAER
jgi:dienelactone hydrolase